MTAPVLEIVRETEDENSSTAVIVAEPPTEHDVMSGDAALIALDEVHTKLASITSISEAK
jgi:hypothetical protein